MPQPYAYCHRRHYECFFRLPHQWTLAAGIAPLSTLSYIRVLQGGKMTFRRVDQSSGTSATVNAILRLTLPLHSVGRVAHRRALRAGWFGVRRRITLSGQETTLEYINRRIVILVPRKAAPGTRMSQCSRWIPRIHGFARVTG